MSTTELTVIDFTVPKFAVYRLMDKDDVLLYVGMSTNLAMRVATHRATQPWGSEIARVMVSEHSTHDEMVAAERVAIQDENPRHNRLRYLGPDHPDSLHGVGRTPIRTFRIPDAIYLPALAAARANGETLSDVIRLALAEYAEEANR